jgi:ribosome modulation factor
LILEEETMAEPLRKKKLTAKAKGLIRKRRRHTAERREATQDIRDAINGYKREKHPREAPRIKSSWVSGWTLVSKDSEVRSRLSRNDAIRRALATEGIPPEIRESAARIQLPDNWPELPEGWEGSETA